jgi:hypothetical protein
LQAASAAQLSGTIRYNGSRGPVSATRPISIYLGHFEAEEPILADVVYVDVNGGAFAFEVPPGEYAFLFYSLDLHNYRDESASVGAPFEVYDNRYLFSFPEPFPADPVAVPQGGLHLEFDDTAIFSGIAGMVTYTGQFPPNGIPPCICVEAFRDPQHVQEARDYCCGNQTRGTDGRRGRYELILLDPGTPYYIHAFVDLNDNRQLDAGEPFYTYAGNPVVASSTQMNVDFSFGDATPTPTESASGTPTLRATPTATVTPGLCSGDCDAGGTVAINEIILMVNIALGSADNSACPHGIPAAATVDISLIIQAVNNALTGCPGR